MRFYLPKGLGLTPKVTPHAEWGHAIVAPPRFWVHDSQNRPVKTMFPCKPGSVVFTDDDRFWVCPPGGHVDIPEPCDVEAILDLAPQLVTVDPEQSLGMPKAVEPVKAAEPEKVEAPVKAADVVAMPVKVDPVKK